MKGKTGELMLVLLEKRLDNVVYRLGLGASRAQARQNVNHGLICVNGKNVNIPSYQVKAGDTITVREGKEDYAMFKAVKDTKIVTPKWLEFDANTLTGKVLTNPERDDIDLNIKEHLIIEKYSR